MENLARSLLLALTLEIRFCSAQKRIFALQNKSRSAVRMAPFLAARPPYLDVVYDSSLAERHLIRNLPGLPFGYKSPMYAGDVSVMEPELRNNGSLFYWLFESQGKPEEDPLIIWINGGPGCSSIEGALIEHGPLLAVAFGYDLELNAHGWNRHANVLYVDQPVGSGFAAVQDGAFARSQHEVNVMFMTFLKRWMNMFPRYQGRPIIFTGESYAGRYIPHFAKQMLAAGGYNLQGIAIGNGWTHPMEQTEVLPEYSHSFGIISSEEKMMLDKVLATCREKWHADPYSQETYDACEPLQHYPLRVGGKVPIGKVNQYDLRMYDKDGGGEWPWRRTGIDEYLNRLVVRAALHVTSDLQWTECSNEVESYLTHEDQYPTVQELQDLLPRLRVLLYNGQFDWICNHAGVERFISGMEFEGKTDFLDPEQRGLFVSESRFAGYVKHGGNMTFVIIVGASHMVPMDKRPQAYDMIMRFVQNKSLSDVKVKDASELARSEGSQAPARFSHVREPHPIKHADLQLNEEMLVRMAGLHSRDQATKLSLLDLSSLAFISLGIALGLLFRPMSKRLWMSGLFQREWLSRGQRRDDGAHDFSLIVD